MNRMCTKKVITRSTQVLKNTQIYSNPYVNKVGTSSKQETKSNNTSNENGGPTRLNFTIIGLAIPSNKSSKQAKKLYQL